MTQLAARVRPTALGIALAAALLFVVLGLGAPRAECDHCLPTFCGHSAECPGDCVCAIPMGEATGTCMGTRLLDASGSVVGADSLDHRADPEPFVHASVLITDWFI